VSTSTSLTAAGRSSASPKEIDAGIVSAIRASIESAPTAVIILSSAAESGPICLLAKFIDLSFFLVVRL